MSRAGETPESTRDAFLSMSQETWDAMMVESRGGMFLTTVEQEGLGLAILERVKRRQEGDADPVRGAP